MQPISDAIHQVEADRPLLSQMSTIWDTLEVHAQAWAAGLTVQRPAEFKRGVVDTFTERKSKHHHVAMDAAYLLDPINFTAGSNDTRPHLPPFECFTQEQRKAIIALIARIAGTDEATVEAELTLAELGQGWDLMKPAAELCMKRTPVEDKHGVVVHTLALVSTRKNFWINLAGKRGYPNLAVAAERLLSLHVTTAAAERNWSAWGRLYTAQRASLGLDKARRLVAIRSRLKADDAGEPQKEAEIALQHMA